MPEPSGRFKPVDRCSWCGYDVASLGFPRLCPECGRDTRTRPPANRGIGIARVITGVVLLVAAAAAAVIAVILLLRNAPAAAIAPPVIVSIAAAATAIAALRAGRAG